MIIDKKSIENMQALKIKHDLDEFPLPSNYMFIQDKYCLFINKYKNNLYQLLASPQCKLSYVHSMALFNVIYSDIDLNKVIQYWRLCVKKVINELY